MEQENAVKISVLCSLIELARGACYHPRDIEKVEVVLKLRERVTIVSS